ncbi:nucleotidyltransferase [Dolosicoccus paucivorans]|uniref:tRNA(Met) cytidine acetate ligase n=1 Tax=Dolosicoccus paucivorans TaxID=84521 RepID=A0A1G8IVR9_9LACT|nr:nucleotidyltransferase [Dolosicoccus paucivorans]PMB84687.1 nucleotidyltransferase [Dolosicoccus paucivorans]PMC59209.1 nucleotidyltransferase [Dolosicoccus paucivorans]SDI23084.1 Predicted nucleotidyltransferase [Dolosicoccus paucivorans]
MKAIGIIAEYNPFHHGHAYQIEQVKQRYQPDVLIVVMSGNVVQRGEFAMIDKWQRAQLALEHGADLVVELPLLASLQSADYFAKESVRLLSRLKCQQVVFGTETARTEELYQFHHWVTDHRQAIDQEIKKHLNKGHSYAYSYQQALDGLQAPLTFDASSSNHILSLQYIRWNDHFGEKMKLLALPRIYTRKDYPILSGSQIRKKWFKGTLTKEQVPLKTWQTLNETSAVSWEDYWPLLQYRLMSDSYHSLEQIVGMKEGIERRFKEYAFLETFEQFIEQMTSKRWSASSLQRLCMAVLLNIDSQTWQQEKKQQSQRSVTRILGFNQRGRLYLNGLKKEPCLQLFTNLTKELEPRYQLSLQADRIYQLNSNTKIDEQIIARYGIYKK